MISRLGGMTYYVHCIYLCKYMILILYLESRNSFDLEIFFCVFHNSGVLGMLIQSCIVLILIHN